MLRDQVVWGIGNRFIQRRLLAEPDLTYDRAVDIAISMSTADKDSREMGNTPTQTPSNKLHYAGQKPAKAGATPQQELATPADKHSTCRFWNAKCHRCSKKGHVQAVCHSGKYSPPDKPPGKEQANLLEMDKSLTLLPLVH